MVYQVNTWTSRGVVHGLDDAAARGAALRLAHEVVPLRVKRGVAADDVTDLVRHEGHLSVERGDWVDGMRICWGEGNVAPILPTAWIRVDQSGPSSDDGDDEDGHRK